MELATEGADDRDEVDEPDSSPDPLKRSFSCSRERFALLLAF
jgi:hypothetical protein